AAAAPRSAPARLHPGRGGPGRGSPARHARRFSIAQPPGERRATTPPGAARGLRPRLTDDGRGVILNLMLNHASASLDRVFQALADPTRRQIVERLSSGPASVSELARPLPMSLPAVVQHLQVLEASGIVSTTKVGRVRTCRIEPEALSVAERWIAARRT